MSSAASIPQDASAAVLKPSDPVPDDAVYVQGPDFEKDLDLDGLLASYNRIGFQAHSLGKAIDIVNKMVSDSYTIQACDNASQRSWRLSDEPIKEDEDEDFISPHVRSQVRCNVFLGYTSNLISSGLRETIRYLVKHKHVTALVTTAGGIEEDFIKCLGKTYLADFNLDGADLRRRGMNRIGNLVVPNDNYCKFEDWLLPILDTMLAEQKIEGTIWTPSSIIHRLGKEINNEDSVYYWAYKVNRASIVFASFRMLRAEFCRTTFPSSALHLPTGHWET
jgi:deoxyhypusine synthase